MKPSRTGPSWRAFGTVCVICLIPALVMTGLHWGLSGMKGWSDGSGVYESHPIKESLPLFALAAIPAAYLPLFGRKVGSAFLVLSLVLLVAYIIYIFPLIGAGNALASVLIGALVLWVFWSVRMAVEKEAPNQISEPTAASGRGSP